MVVLVLFSCSLARPNEAVSVSLRCNIWCSCMKNTFVGIHSNPSQLTINQTGRLLITRRAVVIKYTRYKLQLRICLFWALKAPEYMGLIFQSSRAQFNTVSVMLLFEGMIDER